MDRKFRQKLLHPVTLRAVQCGLDVFRIPKKSDGSNQLITPFFIIGCGRSGTTILRSILQGHPDLHIPPESNGKLPNVIKKFYRYGGLDWQDLIHVLLGEFTAHPHFTYWNLSLRKLQKELLALEGDRQTLQHIIHTIYRRHLAENKPGAVRWGDKSPFNTLRLKWIRRVFPNAQYIEMIRDGRDVVKSYRNAGLITNIDEAADYWKKAVLDGEKCRKKVSEKQFLRLRYENLVTEPNSTARQLCAFLDISYTERMITARPKTFEEDKLNHMKAVKREIHAASIGTWKDELSRADRQKLNKKLGKLLKQYDYS